MSKLSITLVMALATMAVAGQALALNPQPLPPFRVGPVINNTHEPVRHVPVVRF
jgi:hypothetical protein